MMEIQKELKKLVREVLRKREVVGVTYSELEAATGVKMSNLWTALKQVNSNVGARFDELARVNEYLNKEASGRLKELKSYMENDPVSAKIDQLFPTVYTEEEQKRLEQRIRREEKKAQRAQEKAERWKELIKEYGHLMNLPKKAS